MRRLEPGTGEEPKAGLPPGAEPDGGTPAGADRPGREAIFLIGLPVALALLSVVAILVAAFLR